MKRYCEKHKVYEHMCDCYKQTTGNKSASVTGYDADEPREYDISKPKELQRLYRELAGYMKVCRDCGGDFDGRRFARGALAKLREAS